MTTQDIVDRILFLQKSYASTYRFPINYVRYTNLVEKEVVENDDFENILVREELLEHVGHLPILGAALYPYIEHTGRFDLGESLTMLSIHDICELLTVTYSPYARQ